MRVSLSPCYMQYARGDRKSKNLLIVCHGLGDSHRGWLPIVPYLQLRDTRVLVVDAPEPYYDGFSWFPIPGMTGLTSLKDALAGIEIELRKVARFYRPGGGRC